ncbi:patched domain-containing protein 3-like [Salminus brasiliensis]|uniref:patched domain-containing protein 3-like n=1 Tax=Salminus brasiliensis TaxID=930266 RepID=UPI003B82DA54
MRSCNTNCVEKPLSLGFRKFGRCVGKYPWWFLVLPLVLAGGLGSGFYFLSDRERNDIEEQFTPNNGLAKAERAFVKDRFPASEAFSQLRLYTEGTYASLIITSGANILTVEALQEILALDGKVKSITAGNSLTFQSLCAKSGNKCVTSAVLNIVNYNASQIQGTAISYPFNSGVFLGTEVGGVTLKSDNQTIESAKAIRLYYFLKDDLAKETDEWLLAFLKVLSQEANSKTLSISYFTSLSRQEEFKKSPETVIPFFSATYFLAITISVVSCLRLDCVRNKVWVASFGALSAGLAVLSSFGLLLLCGMPFAMTVTTAPFLILGIGVDDMFIMISSWQKTNVHDAVENRLAKTYEEAAVSITITTLTNMLAFYIGIMSSFPSVQSFCVYTGTAILFCYIYNVTFFGAFLAFNGRREKSNRHWLTCMVVEHPKPNAKNNMCAVGGAYDPVTKTEEEMPINTFFKKFYGPFLTKSWTKVGVVLIYAVYLAGSIYGCTQIKEGIELKNLAPDDSYVAKYYDNQHEYFTEFGPNVMVVVKDEAFPYWSESAVQDLNTCLEQFQKLDMVATNMTMFWLDYYLRYGEQIHANLSAKTTFFMHLRPFLTVSGFSQDVNVNYTTQQIYASRLFVQTINIRTAVDEKNMLAAFRQTAEDCPVPLLVYHPAFIYFDQYAVIVSNTIQNVLVATLVMLIISLLLIPNPLCSVWVTFAIASVIAGVAGFMALWDVNLDSISMINLVICVGFSVDFSAHISYACVSSQATTADGKVIDALYNLGYPIIQGAISTVAGVVVLAAVQSYIFRTFFKIMFLVILFGALHGLVFIPVFLTFFGICSSKNSEVTNDSEPVEVSSEQPGSVQNRQKHAYFNPYMNQQRSERCGFSTAG